VRVIVPDAADRKNALAEPEAERLDEMDSSRTSTDFR